MLEEVNCKVNILREGVTEPRAFIWGPSNDSSGNEVIDPDWITKNDVFSEKNSESLFEMLAQKAKEVTTASISIVHFFVYQSGRSIPSPFTLTALDGRYYLMMPALLEALLAHAFARQSNQGSTQFRICTPMRGKTLGQEAIKYNLDWGTAGWNDWDKRYYYMSVTDQWIHATAWAIATRNNLQPGSIDGAFAADVNWFVRNRDFPVDQAARQKLCVAADPVPRHESANYLDHGLVDVVDDGFLNLLNAAARRFEDIGGSLALLEEETLRRGAMSGRTNSTTLTRAVVGNVGGFARESISADDFHRYVALRKVYCGRTER